MRAYAPFVSRFRPPCLALAALLLTAPLSAAQFEMPAGPTPTATALVFETPYLASLPPGRHLAYVYRHTTEKPDLGEGFTETIDLSVAPAADGKREARVAIQRGEQASEAGPFPLEAGNPLVLMAMERDVREIAQLSKGSPFYIRNRLRDALAAATVEPVRIEEDGRSLEGWKLSMTPFAADPNRERLGEIAGRRYEILFAREVPGGLQSIRITTPKADGTGALIETEVNRAVQGAAPAATR